MSEPARLLLTLALLWPLTGSAADGPVPAPIPDPLRPPAGLFAPAAAAAAATPADALVLQATRIGADDRYAVINDLTVRRGDRIGSAEVVHIDAAAVRLRTDDGDSPLQLSSPGISNRPAGRNGTRP